MSLFDYPTADDDDGASPVIFDALSDDDWNRVIEVARLLEFAQGDSIVETGDQDDSVFIVVEGAVEVVAKRKVIAEIAAGSAFGEIAFFDRQPRTAGVRAKSDGRALVMDRDSVERLRGRDVDLAWRIVMELGRLLAVRNRRLIRLV